MWRTWAAEKKLGRRLMRKLKVTLSTASIHNTMDHIQDCSRDALVECTSDGKHTKNISGFSLLHVKPIQGKVSARRYHPEEW